MKISLEKTKKCLNFGYFDFGILLNFKQFSLNKIFNKLATNFCLLGQNKKFEKFY